MTIRYSADAARRQPRPYQSECVEKALEALNPEKPTLVHLATGGGKTFVGNNVVAQCLGDGRDYVLWITKDWWLLRQAATDIAQRYRGMARHLRRLGGEHKELHDLPPYGNGERDTVLYTTLQTFKRRLDTGDLPAETPKLIVWDECHWALTRPSGKALMSYGRCHSIPVLGLTATPKHPGGFEIACSHTYGQLVSDGFIANYQPVMIRTGARWSPRRYNNADFTDDSLRVLSEDEGRNQKIVDEYVSNAKTYGKSIMFACNIDHAEALAKALGEKGVAATAIHSDLDAQQCEEVIEQFARSEVSVLVNVAKLTHGISIPDIRSVFLCRPTTSDILFSQMVGRGAHRRTDAREDATFNLVEFTDNLAHFEHVLHANEFFGSPGNGADQERCRDSRRWRHEIDRGFEPRWTGGEGSPEVRDLWYRQQSFGVEFELTIKKGEPDDIPEEEYFRVGRALLRYLRDQLGGSRVRTHPCGEYHEDENYDRWKVEPDGSVGWEVVSPKLKGREGMIELHDACVALSAALDDDDLGLDINWRCGTHVHIGWDAKHVARALQLTHMLEPILRSLVPPSRFARFEPEKDSYDTDVPNEYCRPISDVYEDALDEDALLADVQSMAETDPSGQLGRTIGLNVTPLFDGNEDQRHIEVRLLGGTTDAGKLLPWLSLWMRILWRAERPLEENLLAHVREPNAAFPGLHLGDVLHPDVVGVPGERASFRNGLRRRQEEIFRNWREHEELCAWLPRVPTSWELEVERSLAKMIDPAPTVHDFWELDNEAQKVAVWCTLVGEGPLERDEAKRLSARRLREQEWVYYERLDKHSLLYRRVSNLLQGARRSGADGWFDIPRRLLIRAFRRFDEMHGEDWRRCVVEALRDHGGVTRNELHYAVLAESKVRFGVDRENLVKSVRRKIDSAITGCILRRYILREGRERFIVNEGPSG